MLVSLARLVYLVGLPLRVPLERVYGPLGESYLAATGVLGFGELERAGRVPVPAHPLQLAHDVEGAGVEVYVRPPERQRLALPEGAQQAQDVEGFVAVPARGVQNRVNAAHAGRRKAGAVRRFGTEEVGV